METRLMYFNLINFAEWLSTEIEKQHISVAKLSKISGVHQNTVHNYLSHRCEPTFYNVVRIANALGYEVGAIPK